MVIKKTKQTPACVNSENVEKLREKNWAVSKQFQETIFAEIASKIEYLTPNNADHSTTAYSVVAAL